MLSANPQSWTPTFVATAIAVATAGAGLALSMLYPGAAPLVATGLLTVSLTATTVAFARIALRVRRLELENEGLIEELSQEFDRVKDKLEIFGEALLEPRDPAAESVDDAPLRRVAVK